MEQAWNAFSHSLFINLFYDILPLVSSVGRRGVVCYGRVSGRVVVDSFVLSNKGGKGACDGLAL